MFATMDMKVADFGMLEYFFNILSYSFDRENNTLDVLYLAFSARKSLNHCKRR